MAEAKWYVVHTYSGYENKVKANIDKTIENHIGHTGDHDHAKSQISSIRLLVVRT